MNLNKGQNYLTALPKFITSPKKIKCSKHPDNIANSYCTDCEIFICNHTGCGNTHLFHQIENLDDLIFNQILPKLKELININSKYLNNEKELNKNKVVKSFINLSNKSLKKKIIEEKENINNKFLECYTEIQNLREEYFSQIDIITNNIKTNLDNLSKNFINQKLNELNKDLIKKINLSDNNLETLIKKIGKKDYISNMNNIIKDNKSIKKENINNEKLNKKLNEFEKMKENSFEEINKKIVNLFNNIIKNIKNEYDSLIKNNKDLNKSIKDNSWISQKKLSFINYSSSQILGIDLDLFIRDLENKINNERKLNGNKQPLTWDNDLSNAIEDYFQMMNKQNNGIIDLNNLQNEIKNILIESYYYDNNYLNNIISIPYINDVVDIDKIFNYIVKYSNKNIYNENYNIIGINGEISRIDSSKINLILNLGIFN